MGHIFSRKKESRVTQQDRALLELKTSRDRIKQYQKRSESILEKDRLLVKELLVKKKKERALLVLKKKRFIEEKLTQADGQLEGIEKMIQDLEFAQVEMKVIDSLKVGNESLKLINELLSVEDIEKILDETAEAAEKQKEISGLLSGDVLEDIDESSLEQELETLLGEPLERQLPDVPSAAENPEIVLPDVPEDENERRRVSAKEKKIAVEAM